MDRTALRAGDPLLRSHVIFDTKRLREALRRAGPPLIFGLRLWTSVYLALYVAFRLELDNAFSAGTMAAIVSQPQLGASLNGLRRLARGRTPGDRKGRLYGRLSALPEQATPLQRARLLAALSVGTEVTQLRYIAHRLDWPAPVADRSGLLRHVSHPSLFTAAFYMIVLSSMVLAVGH
jgi:hypothetical protein